MPFDFKEAINLMEDYGLYDVVLPFLLVFTLVFATLQKIQIFGKESKRYNAMIALVMSLMFVAATNLVESLNKYLPVIGLVLAIFLGLMLMLGIFGVKEGTGVQKLGWILAGVVALIVGFTYIPELSGIGSVFQSFEDYYTIIIILAIFIGLVAWVVKSGGTPSKPA